MTAPALTLNRVRSNDPILRYELHRPEGAVRGAVFLTHGYAEHSGRYMQWINEVVGRGFMVARYDLRGHGHSGGMRGHVNSFDEYLVDADELRTELLKDQDWRNAGPPVLVGHSLGGLITFHLGLRDPGHARAVLLSSPYFGLALAVPAAKRVAGQWMSKILPTFALPTGLKGSDCTRDPEISRLYDEDPLGFPKATARFFTESVSAQQKALEQATEFHLPLLIMAGGADKVASVEATRKLFERVGASKKELRVLEGMYHEIWNEPERARWISDAADAIERFCS